MQEVSDFWIDAGCHRCIKALCRKSLIFGLMLVATVASTVAWSLVMIAIASVVVVLVLYVGLAGECIDKSF